MTVSVDPPGMQNGAAAWLSELAAQTPVLVTDLGRIRADLADFRSALPGIEAHYAVKCNPSPPVLDTVHDAGASFEVASLGELLLLVERGIDPQTVLFSNPVKPWQHIRDAAQMGVWRFAVDSRGELAKIAAHAPGSSIYVRLRVDDSSSVFPLGRKFGAGESTARALLRAARKLGLDPYGLTFHVGSQCLVPSAWTSAIRQAGRLMADLETDGIGLQMLDVGGGFPARYVDAVPGIDEFGLAVATAVRNLLPYRPDVLAAEPGRCIVAESSVLVSSVIGRSGRGGATWLYLDVGAYNGLMETQQTGGRWHYPIWTSLAGGEKAPQARFTVCGPSCDSADTMWTGIQLPADIDVGDQLMIGSAGAYTLSYASNFNGFPPPRVLFVG